MAKRDYGRYGYVAISDPKKPLLERNSYLCCHCQRLVIVTPGSGKKRSWCFRCAANTCGGEGGTDCATRCVPWEAKLEAMEGRRRFWKQLELDKNGKVK